MTRPRDLANELSELVNPQPQPGERQPAGGGGHANTAEAAAPWLYKKQPPTPRHTPDTHTHLLLSPSLLSFATSTYHTQTLTRRRLALVMATCWVPRPWTHSWRLCWHWTTPTQQQQQQEGAAASGAGAVWQQTSRSKAATTGAGLLNICGGWCLQRLYPPSVSCSHCCALPCMYLSSCLKQGPRVQQGSLVW